MKTYCKLLATSWMVLRPLCPNVHADNDIHWREISHFFNFDTIVEEEKRTNLETNIRLLVEEQLKLPSGQNLWKAFQFWEKQHPELGFQFEFTLMGSASAHIELKKYEDWSQTFRFEITCNEIFAENHRVPHWHKISCDLESNLALKRFLNINMLYRPCLIKLIDPNNPAKWEYHLREQKLPFFITLAHEFLHALNQLERIDKVFRWLKVKNVQGLVDKLEKLKQEDLIFDTIFRFNNPQKPETSKTFNQEKQAKNRFQNDLKELIGDYKEYNELILDLLNKIMPIQSFLAIKVNLLNNADILQEKHEELWKNIGVDDSLDEMTVILGSQRKIGSLPSPFIGETTFLQEYYHDDSIISWSHYLVSSIEFWEKMYVILEKSYVNNILDRKEFGLDFSKIKSVIKEKFRTNPIKFYYVYYENNSEYKTIKNFLECKKNKQVLPKIMIIRLINIKTNKEVFLELTTPKINNSFIQLLPQVFLIEKNNQKHSLIKEVFETVEVKELKYI